MQNFIDQILGSLGSYLPNIVGALLILVIGWLVAIVISYIVKRIVRKTTLDDKLSRWLSSKKDKKSASAEQWIGKGVFYLIMLFVLVAFFQALQLTIITEPLNGLLNKVFDFAPQLLGAGILILLAWLIASVIRLILTKTLSAVKLDERLSAKSGQEDKQIPLTKSLAEAAYWLVFLLFLPAILSALELEGLLAPIQGMINKILDFMPNILTAAIIAIVGWFVARIVQKILVNLFDAIGVDRLTQKLGLSSVLGEQKLSSLLGLIVYIFILIPVIISALNALALEAITTPASNMLNIILNAVPSIFAALFILIIAYILGKVLSGLISKLLAGIGFDNVLVKIGLSKKIETAHTPSSIAGTITLVTIMFFAFTEAFSMLGFSELSDLSSQFIVFGSHILLGLVIFGAGLYLANLVAQTVKQSSSAQAGLLSFAARMAIIVLAGAMALRQMGLANEIINMAFGLLLGAIAVAVAISFGIGGRELAAEKLKKWFDTKNEKQRG